MSYWLAEFRDRLRHARSPRASHVAAMVGVGVALGLTWALWPVMEANPLLFFLVVVAISSWYGGLRPGLTATAGSTVVLYGLMLEAGQGLVLDGFNVSRLGLFALVCLLLAGFSESRRRAERLSRRTDETFGQLFEAASEAIVIVDQRGRVVRINQAAERIFGYTRGELVGQSIEVLVPASARQRHAQHRAAYVAEPHNRPMGQGMGLRAVRKDGSEFPVEISLSHVRDGEQVRVMSFITNISARKEAEAALARYQEQLRELTVESVKAEQRERRRIAVDLHDRIGQTLALCQIKLGGLRSQVEGEVAADVDECIALVQQSVDDTRGLTFELSPPVLYDLGLKAALSWLADQMREEHRLEVEVEVDVEAAEVPWFEDEFAALLFRSVRELLINVVKHAQVGSARVRLDCTSDRLTIEVADEGVGFDTEAVGRGEGSKARFGLFSIREQIERVGGVVVIDAVPGCGTRVCLGVPVPEATTHQASAHDADADTVG